MADHPNAELLRKGYEAFDKGDIAALTDMPRTSCGTLPAQARSPACTGAGRRCCGARQGDAAERRQLQDRCTTCWPTTSTRWR